MKKILTIVGVRPQFIKATVLSRQIARCKLFEEVIVHTGQHYDREMNDVFFSELSLPKPKYNLNVRPGLHGQQTGKMLEGIESVIINEKPALVVVYGDTNSTLAGALAAVKLHIPLAHVEAGLRSFNRRMPEEINRIIVDSISDILLCPTQIAVDNLIREGVPQHKIHLVGDVMFDAALHFSGIARERSEILKTLGVSSKEYILASVHRAENTNSRAELSAIIEGLKQVAAEIPVVLPLHPRTRAKLLEYDMHCESSGKFIVCEPVGYLDMVMLEINAKLIATDSGGVQKEAFFFSVPCVTLRTETEWVELVDSGWNRLLSPESREKVACGVLQALSATCPETQGLFYGNGEAGRGALKVLEEYLLNV